MLESQAVDAIFRRMRARYGSAWEAKWAGVPIDDVRADWARELSGARRELIIYALGFLPLDFPPNATQFRAICARAPEREVPRLEAPPADPARIAEVVDQARAATLNGHPRMWVYRLRQKQRVGEPLSAAQRHCLAQCRDLPDIEALNEIDEPRREAA